MTDLSAVEMEKRQERKARFRSCVGLALLAVVTGWSVVHVTIRAFGPDSDTSLIAGKQVIRFAHWQLEGRCVEALNQACRDYERLKREKDGIDVAVRQIEIPERAYEQWTRTQLIGRTAPDLIELRWWQDLVVRYFVPLTEYVEQPNPWNEFFDKQRDPNFDPELVGLPWRETYIDNMLGGWNWELRDYYGMPMSLFTIRVYANRTLMEQAAGVTEPPRTLGEFMDICERIRRYAAERRKADPDYRLVPIAGSDYTASVFRGRYWGMGTWGMLDDYDENCDGWFDDAERIEAVYGGELDLTVEPNVRAGHRVLYDISRYFNPGFMAAKRDQSVLLFAQSKAAMIATGTWDAGSLWRQVSGDFEIMVFDFPIAAPDEKYGQFLQHRLTEAGARAGFSMGLTRFSQNKELAIDFMRFLTSRHYNEKLNRAFRWFPAIRGAEPDPILKAFRPEEKGIYGVFEMFINPGDTRLRYEQKYFGYMSQSEPTTEMYVQFLADLALGTEAFQARHSDARERLLAERIRARLGG
ncbi:MAG TPA: extracellular solute-binding protein, partial [Phycisphaerae bacterium]|nr:extracellular solute-binding protein [Phycisphaerae bacterium]